MKQEKRLPFVVIDGNSKDLWSVKPTGNWSDDTAIGRQYAQELLNHMAENDNPGLLYHVAKAMAGKAQFGGIECGFYTHLASALQSG